MAISKTTLVNTAKRYVVKYVVTGQAGTPVQDTIALASILAPNQVVSGTPDAAIISVYTTANTPTTMTITRNSVPTLKTYGTNDFQYVAQGSFTFKENGTSDLVVDFSDDGTFIIELRKESGYTFGVELQNAGV